MNESKQFQWRVEPMKIHGWAIYDADGNVVVNNIYDEEIARFIVRAVNSHEALVDALKRTRDWMKEPMGGHLLHERFDGKTECESDCLRCAVNAAISLAEKES